MNSFIVIVYDTPYRYHKEHHICPCCKFRHEELNPDKQIPEYDSIDDVIDAGWRKTTHTNYCPPGVKFAWLCPACAKDTKSAINKDDIRKFITNLKEEGRVSYEEMLDIVSNKYGVSQQIVNQIAQGV